MKSSLRSLAVCVIAAGALIGTAGTALAGTSSVDGATGGVTVGNWGPPAPPIDPIIISDGG